MKITNLKTLGAGIAALALMLALATSAGASIVITQQGGPVITGSWTVGWLASGGSFDEIIGTVLDGNTFEIPGLRTTVSGWSGIPGTGTSDTISGPATGSLLYSTTFNGLPTDLPPELISFQIFDAGVLVSEEELVWNQNEINLSGTLGEFDVVPEPTTMIAGALLLLPFGVSAFRILRRNRIA